ncbi:MAG: murein biosynthesis integral membrane protein MurJ [Elusimicrobia bacterium]|nr:murein biosynthesis integral membrane protein MurJ [Elusimicrobiota bacterium]
MNDKKFAKFFSGTLISRVFGYARDLAIAHFVGGGGWADLYFATYRLANIFRNLVGEGGLYAAYTPVYSPLLAKDKDDAAKFAHAYAGKLFLILFFLVVMGLVFAKQFTSIMLLGFSDEPIRMSLAVHLTKILLPFLLFIALAAWAQATVQANGKFFFSSFSPAFASLAIIFYLLYPRPHTLDPISLIIGLAWATTLGGLFQYLVLLPQLLASIGYRGIRSLWDRHPELMKSAALFGPYFLTFSLDQINSFIGTFFGSFAQPGAIAALYNSSRLIQLPLGLIGVGSLVTSLPELSQMVAAGEREAVQSALKRQIRRVLIFQIPAMAVFVFFGSWIIRLLYFHGQFDTYALKLTSNVLAVTAPSLLFYSLQKICLSLFYAHKDTKSLILTSAVSLGINAGLCAVLVRIFGAVGIGAAAAISSFFGLAAMAVLAKRKNYF